MSYILFMIMIDSFIIIIYVLLKYIMGNILLKLFDIHSSIGKIFTTLCVALLITAIIGIFMGKTVIKKNDDIVETNHFLNESVPFHDNNYELKVNSAKNNSHISIKDKNGDMSEIDGQFICVNITISQRNDSKLKKHKIDTNDFKLKDHTGVYLPLNSIMGALGWDAIDVHIDDNENGHIMSSTTFSTTNVYDDYNYIGLDISSSDVFTFDLYFEMDEFIDVTKELIVLEVDFFYTSADYKKGTDIVLLNNPF